MRLNPVIWWIIAEREVSDISAESVMRALIISISVQTILLRSQEISSERNF